MELLVYIWTLTGGGRHLPGEWRIQPTGVAAFLSKTATKTVILGYEPSRDLFVGFDRTFHQGTLGSSSSIQIREQALDTAMSSGFGPWTRGNGEVAIAIRPEVLGTYIAVMRGLHGTGTNSSERALMQEIGSDPESIEPEDVDTIIDSPRRHALKTTLRTLRDSRFRKRVLSAYDHCCAACNLQLELLDGAHILPVGHPESNDKTSNGIAFCALHHRAYDGALITFDTTHLLHVSEEIIATLQSNGFGGGLAEFRSALNPTIRVPTSRIDRPDLLMVEKANALRGWSL